MIKVNIIKNSQGIYKGFKLIGHAGYAEHGYDIVCSAVSILVINTINSIETFTNDSFDYSEDEKSGMIAVDFNDKISKESTLLIDAMVLGLETIQKDYNNKYIHLKFKEV